jgi:hypothetical protein
MTLREQQSLFVLLVSTLIRHAYEMGYEFTFGECYRTPAQAAINAKDGVGISRSLHTQRLAIDLNLFRDGKFLTESEYHKPLGEFWKTLHPLCRWGGDFKPRPDGNHYSMEFGGIK